MASGKFLAIPRASTAQLMSAEEVVTTDDEEDEYIARPPTYTPSAPPPPRKGAFETVHDPDDPIITDETIAEILQKPLCFFVRTTADDDASHRLCRITIPRSWATATVGRLVELLAKRAGLPGWDCHLHGPRGPVGNGLPLAAALVRKETVELQRGPPPVAAERARNDRRSLWVWGRCVDGALHPRPIRQPGLGRHEIHRLGLGDEHVLALTAVGLVLTWGRNDCGQLGTGDEFPHALPAVVRSLAVVRCVEVASGARCSGAIDADGQLWSFGANQPSNRPLRFHTSWANRGGKTACGLDCQAVAFGPTHSLLLSKARAERPAEVWTWGYNDSLQLGWADAQTTAVLRHGFQKPRYPLPLDVEGAVVAIACGEAHSACLTSCGDVYAWGDNSTGQCGSGALLTPAVGAFVATPSLLPMPRGDTRVCKLQALGNATLVVTASGRAYTLGGGGRVRGPEDDASDDDQEADEPIVEEEEGGEESAANGGGAHGGGDGSGEGGGEGGASTASMSRGLGRLLGAKMIAEGVDEVSGCEDHLLLLLTNGQMKGLGYNRYRQANPDASDLVLHESKALRAGLFNHQRLLYLAAGGGCSAAVTQARESLAACCVAVMQARLEEGDARRCAETLALARRVDTPALAPLLPAAEACCRRKRTAVAAALAEAGEAMDVDEGLEALASIHRAAAGMDVE